MKLCIKMVASEEPSGRSPCALCQKSVNRSCGPEVFVEGTEQVVCRSCAKEQHPALEHLLAIYNHPGSMFCDSCGGYLSLEERSPELRCNGCRAPQRPPLFLLPNPGSDERS